MEDKIKKLIKTVRLLNQLAVELIALAGWLLILIKLFT